MPRTLVEANAPYWAAEAEIVRTYFQGPRTPESERRWIRRQAFKELWDGCWPHLEAIQRILDGTSAAGLADHAATLADEARHFEAFAALYEAAGGEPLQPAALRSADWPENTALRALRDAHEQKHGSLGRRARWLTEGGHMALYREGARLAGRGGLDDHIARVCAAVHDDEAGHMSEGLAGIDDLCAGDLAVLAEISVAQLRQRLEMRAAQFGQPVSQARMADLRAGRCAPSG